MKHQFCSQHTGHSLPSPESRVTHPVGRVSSSSQRHWGPHLTVCAVVSHSQKYKTPYLSNQKYGTQKAFPLQDAQAAHASQHRPGSRGASTFSKTSLCHAAFICQKGRAVEKKPSLNYGCFQPQQAAPKVLWALVRPGERAEIAALLPQQLSFQLLSTKSKLDSDLTYPPSLL